MADADLNEGIVAGCLRREPTMDFLSANEANLSLYRFVCPEHSSTA